MAGPSFNPGLNPGPQARFNVTEMARFIESHGLDYRWSRALVCPCTLGTETHAFDPTCTRCVDGWLYVNPLFAQEPEADRAYTTIKAVVSQVTFDNQRGTWVPSPWVTNRAQITVYGTAPVSYRDRFVGINQRATFSQVLVKSDAELVTVGWLGRDSARQRDSFRYEPITVHYVVGADGTVYRSGTDWVIANATATEPRRLRWLPSGEAPAEGELYSVSYDCHPVWLIDDAAFAIQNSYGPASGLASQFGVQYLPTTYSVVLDWIPHAQGS